MARIGIPAMKDVGKAGDNNQSYTQLFEAKLGLRQKRPTHGTNGSTAQPQATIGMEDGPSVAASIFAPEDPVTMANPVEESSSDEDDYGRPTYRVVKPVPAAGSRRSVGEPSASDLLRAANQKNSTTPPLAPTGQQAGSINDDVRAWLANISIQEARSDSDDDNDVLERPMAPQIPGRTPTKQNMGAPSPQYPASDARSPHLSTPGEHNRPNVRPQMNVPAVPGRNNMFPQNRPASESQGIYTKQFDNLGNGGPLPSFPVNMKSVPPQQNNPMAKKPENQHASSFTTVFNQGKVPAFPSRQNEVPVPVLQPNPHREKNQQRSGCQCAIL